jgi:hypothetical protein
MRYYQRSERAQTYRWHARSTERTANSASGRYFLNGKAELIMRSRRGLYVCVKRSCGASLVADLLSICMEDSALRFG